MSFVQRNFGRYARPPAAAGKRRQLRLAVWLAILAFAGSAAGLAIWEVRTSHFQSQYLAEYARDLNYEIGSGASSSTWFPKVGPYNERLGYTRLPNFVEQLRAAGFRVEAQARLSPVMLDLAARHLTPPYREKTQAGLSVVDREGDLVFRFRYPERIYESYESVPPIIVQSLLFIEDRSLLDAGHAKRNPAVDWPRLARAAFERGLRTVGKKGNSPGGSTLATQLEKGRHSDQGVTRTIHDKLRQIASASLKAYLGGTNTWEHRKQIVVDYLNTLPLSARAGYGEIMGMAAGLEQWYGSEFEAVNQLLHSSDEMTQGAPWAKAYKQVLSLLLAQRRPNHYLLQDRDALNGLADKYLRLMAQADVIAPKLADEALKIRLEIRGGPVPILARDIWELKAANAVRPQLLSLLGLQSYYELDRIDLTAKIFQDRSVQDDVTNELRSMADPEHIRKTGFDAPRLLDRGDPARVRYSVSLYERGEGVNWLRVQADNVSTPFNMDEGAMLDMGSTAKLRTLVSYLGIVAKLYEQYAPLPPEDLRLVKAHPTDVLTGWVVNSLLEKRGMSLRALLDGAMDRRYSANPGEVFLTGGAPHRFANFDRKHNRLILTVREAFRNSVNLVFVRIMRDVVRFHQFRLPDSPSAMLDDPSDPRRVLYLERFADREGRIFLKRFYQKYRAKTPAEIQREVLGTAKTRSTALAAVLRYIRPDANEEEFGATIRARLPEQNLHKRTITALYSKHSADRYDLQDRGFVSGVHPLELWLVAYLQQHPAASLSEVMEHSAEARLDVYRWLFATRRRHKQDVRIQTLLEMEAFVELHREWQRLGYPFQHLVPSYATAIGSAADRPAALAELIGILMNEGVRYPIRKIEWLHFGQGTPYETVLVPAISRGERVLPAAVAAVARDALVDVVENGTAQRARGAVVDPEGDTVLIGGKTGTGDHREKIFAPDGRQQGERVVNRSASFVFFVGDRFFGIVTAHVAGEAAEQYRFTSALAVQLFKALIPQLLPVLARKPDLGVEVSLQPPKDEPAS